MYALSYVMKTGTCYSQFQPRSDSGYVDVFVEFADGQELFVNRINTGKGGSHPSYGSQCNNTYQLVMSRVCLCSGYDTAVKIWLRPQKGTFSLFGLGWKSEDRESSGPAFVHSDNIMGDPSSLNDERIKDNVTNLDPSNCLSFCNALQPSLYLQTLANEVRTGLVAQSVQAALTAHNLPETPVPDAKRARVDEDSPLEQLMAMRYERLAPMLLGAVKELTNRITQLESQLTQR